MNLLLQAAVCFFIKYGTVNGEYVMKPLIALNLDVSVGPPEKYTLYKTYADSISANGGIPILVPPMVEADLDQILQTVQGVMLIGGDDYSPQL